MTTTLQPGASIEKNDGSENVETQPPQDLKVALEIGALRRTSQESALEASRLALSSIPHVLGSSFSVEYLWSPESGLSVAIQGSGVSLDGMSAALDRTHEIRAVVTAEPARGIDCELSTIERNGFVLDANASHHPTYLPQSKSVATAARHISSVLQLQRDPVFVRFVATAVELTPDEEEAVVSSYPDAEATDFARLMRRAEGARSRTDQLFRLLPTFEVSIVVGAPRGHSGVIAAAVAAALSNAGTKDDVCPSFAVRAIPTPVERHGGGWGSGFGTLPHSTSRLHRLYGSGDLDCIIPLPFATEATFPGLVVRRSRQRDRTVRTSTGGGLLLGTARSGVLTTEVRLRLEDLNRHLVVTGQTGTGKSRMLESLAVQQAQAGEGFAFIDPHGDSADRIMERMPRSRIDDVVVFDPSTPSGRLAINPLEADSEAAQEFIVQDLSEMFYDLFDPSRQGVVGPRFEAWLRMGALTLIDAKQHGGPAGSIIDIPKLFSDDEFLKERFKHVRAPHIHDFWIHEMGRTSDFHRSEMLGWFASKFDRFSSNGIMREMLGTGRNDLNLHAVMNEGKILIVRLPKGLIGGVNASLLGYFLTSRIWTAALGRASAPAHERRPFTLFIDEFQSFTSATSIGAMLSEARKFGLRLVLANQFQSQLNEKIRDAVEGNCGNRLTFRVGVKDAAAIAPLYAGAFDAEDLTHLPNLEAAAVLLQGGETQAPFTLSTVTNGFTTP
ncbi:putative ATPase [Actinobacteria bacterium IMCC26256]|nr:putative ATPase [Actinobacteria bacterium IMCC26256]